MKREKDELLNSNYDGIEEYDNDLPRWWLQLFYLTIVLGVAWTAYVHLGFVESDEQRVAREMSAMKAQVSAAQPTGPTTESLLALISNPQALNIGQIVFATKCAACHGDKGQGIIGPNLTDDYWIHGGTIKDIHTVVTNGVVDKGMLAWAGMLKKDELEAVVAYVWTLHGTNPPNPKDPQGEPVIRP